MSELRRDPVVGRWVIIAPERGRRPIDGENRQTVATEARCPFCEGHEADTPRELFAWRDQKAGADGPGWSLRIIPNKYPALDRAGDGVIYNDGLYRRMEGVGAHEVVVETPRHTLGMGEMTIPEVERVLRAWRDRTRLLQQRDGVRYVMVFKNQGRGSGASQIHSHSQIIALPVVPKFVVEEMTGAERHYQQTGTCVYCSLLERETRDRSLHIAENTHFTVTSAYAPRKPFEMWLLPRDHAPRFEETEDRKLQTLAGILRSTLARLKSLLDDPPFNIVLHTTPAGFPDCPHYHWHLEILPDFSTIAGFEWGAGFYINHLPPEFTTAQMRHDPEEMD